MVFWHPKNLFWALGIIAVIILLIIWTSVCPECMGKGNCPFKKREICAQCNGSGTIEEKALFRKKRKESRKKIKEAHQ